MGYEIPVPVYDAEFDPTESDSYVWLVLATIGAVILFVMLAVGRAGAKRVAGATDAVSGAEVL